ncbi:GDP-mannose 4,6-dehydratase [Candidatus Palauibacter sp.]|uniref:GDP-mannose 4,6-dehydratase n=1 Tax=Candidatus Palauibacter sp. TaxID=3101350 RepID=UPI003B51C83A
MTGGDGFIGQHLVELLLGRGYEVTATMLGEAPAQGTLSPAARAAAEWKRLDVRDADAVASVVDATRPCRIFHLAGFSSGAEASTRSRDALAVNGAGTLSLVEAAARAPADVQAVVVAGSADAYGRGGDGPLGERTPLRPVSVYGATKAAQDVLARGAGAALGVRVVVARIFPLAGPGQGPAFVLPSFCRRALAIRQGTAEPRLAVGNLDVARDFTDVRDGVRALADIAGLDGTPHMAYNVCSGVATKIRRLLEWVLERAEIQPEVVRDPALLRTGEPEIVVGDPARLRAATGWRAERDLRACACATMDWFARSGAA